VKNKPTPCNGEWVLFVYVVKVLKCNSYDKSYERIHMEILLGLMIAVVWHIKSTRGNHYDDEDWEKIKNDWLK
tara:strand:+ start:65 stop:283 length:219 start_codon:yes stop_codon:yes gene_type:complete